MEQVKVYYQEGSWCYLAIDDEQKEIHIYPNCPYEFVDKDELDDYIEEKMDWGEWDAYVIPDETTEMKLIYHTN